MDAVVTISDRGQITIPKSFRDSLVGKRLLCTQDGDGKIVLEVFQRKEEFLLELDQIEADWQKNGGLGLMDVKKKYSL